MDILRRSHFKEQKLISPCSGRWKSKIQEPAGLVTGEGGAQLPRWYLSAASWKTRGLFGSWSWGWKV